MLGTDILAVEVTNISRNGIWLLVRNSEYFLPFEKFPWFSTHTVEEIVDVQELRENHFYWPKLDVDLTKEMIENPDNYPLVSQ